MSEHSLLPPSSAARRVACPGSRKLESFYPQEEGEAAKEGTLAHGYASDKLRKAFADQIGDEYYPEEKPPISSEMAQHVQLYVNHVLDMQTQNVTAYGYPELHIESRLNISRINEHCWGTPDAWFIANRVLHMFDFKYGFGFVDAVMNWQMIEYAAGIEEEFDAAVFHIIQPRCYAEAPIRLWSICREELENHWLMLMSIERQAMTDNARTSVSEQCVNCKARHACPALQLTVLNNINCVDNSTPMNLDNNAIGNELRILHNAAKLLDARITGLEQEALAKLKAGNRIPHYELGEVRSLERWAKDAKEISALGKLFDVEIEKPVEVEFITPKQAIKAGIPAEVVRNYSHTPQGAKKLVAIDPKKIRKMFS